MHKNGNNAIIDFKVFTTWKQKIRVTKYWPPVSIEPLAQDSKSSMPPYP